MTIFFIQTHDNRLKTYENINMKNMGLHLVYSKLNTKFEKLWYHQFGEKHI